MLLHARLRLSILSLSPNIVKSALPIQVQRFLLYAGDERIELPTSVLETEVIPLN